MTSTNKKVPPAEGKPLATLVTYGKLEDVLRSQASPAIKAACIEMGLEAAARRTSEPGSTD